MDADELLLDTLLLDLLRRFGREAVRARLERLSKPPSKGRGRPRLRDFDGLLQVWLRVQIQRHEFSSWSIARICKKISKHGGVSHASYKDGEINIRTIRDEKTLRRTYYEADKLAKSNIAIAKAWGFQLESVLGVERSPAFAPGRLGSAPAAAKLSDKSEKKTLN